MRDVNSLHSLAVISQNAVKSTTNEDRLLQGMDNDWDQRR